VASAVDEIKRRLDIVETVGSYVALKKAGRNFKGLCPFHREKTPSFIVFPESQRWYCFGACNTGGDLFTFIIKAENLEFAEALRLLSRKAVNWAMHLIAGTPWADTCSPKGTSPPIFRPRDW